MIAGLSHLKMPRGTLFVVFNVAAVLFVVMFLVAPILAHFASRGEDISENAEQLAHFQNVVRESKVAASGVRRAGDPFLPGSEERVVSADLQASLKSIAANAGVNLLGIRGLQSSRSQLLRMIAVNVEMEGSLRAVRDMILAIENQTPLLFVSAVSLRSVTDGEDGPIRAELKIQGAMRDGSASAEKETVAQ
jgi:general secretion pathway protein M